MQMVVAIDDNIPLLADVLAACADIRVFCGRSLSSDQLDGVDVLFVRSTTKVNERLLAGTSVRFVGTATAGIDHIDVDYLAERDIAWVSAAGCNAASVAEYVVSAALDWAQRHKRLMRDATVGIVGVGHVGSRVGELAHRLGATVLVNDPPRASHRSVFPVYCRHIPLDELVQSVDILTLHVPLEYGGQWPTNYLIDAEQLRALRPGSLLIQAARGGVVRESALLPLVESGCIEAAVDVWEGEPLPNEQLVRLCALATPHIAGHSFEGKLRGSAALAAAFVGWTGLEPDMDILDQAFDNDKVVVPDFSDEQQVAYVLHSYRKFSDDDAFLRSLAVLNADERAQRFDAYRSRYPVRHETLL